MNIFLVLTIALAIIVVLLRFKCPIGPAMLAAGVFIWVTRSMEPLLLVQAAKETLSLQRTYDIILALYFVMCLEIELRTSGALSGMVSALEKIFSGVKFTLAVMPAFLGLLPSLGGARFSAPIVEEASKDLNLSPAHKSAINFWFRHIFEFSNPIAPGVIMVCAITNVPYHIFVTHMGWLTILAFILGYIFLIRPIKATIKTTENALPKQYGDIVLSLSSVVLNVLLIVLGKLSPSEAMFIVVLFMFAVLKLLRRNVNFKEVFTKSLDVKMLLNVLAILYFIQILTVTNTLQEVVRGFNASFLPNIVIIASISFIIGILTGLAQGHAAIVMPIVAAMGSDMTMISTAMIFGVAGQMLTPTHMCLVITVDYFKADLLKTLYYILTLEAIILTIFTLICFIG